MSLDEKNNKDTENSRVSYSEYQDLTPIDHIENGEEYIAALNWVFHNKKIKNIALTGPYGAGKSSIIETFLAEDEKAAQKKCCLKRLLPQNKAIRKSALKISMATFEKGNPPQGDEKGKIPVGADEVEQGILKQLFYKVEPSKIPQSRYRKLHEIRLATVFRNIVIGLVLIGVWVAIFNAPTFDKYKTAITDFLPPCLSAPFFTYAMMGILLVAISAVGSYLYITVISRFKIKEIKLPTDTTVQSDRESTENIFNKNLDEIIYFFERTRYKTVFFEDLDRLSDPKIFVHLRELNNLLNNDDAIKDKPIVFVYAVRDDIFSREDRTKFFDFIVPVIPVMNSTNSGDILLEMRNEANKNGAKHNISDEFVLDVAPFISDRRILQNIYNEFVVDKKTLSTSQGLTLSDEQMLAMMVFKNLYPSDFADVQDEKGIVKKAFQNKQTFIAKQKKVIQEQIDVYTDTITGAQRDVMKDVRELKYAMMGALMKGFYEFSGFGDQWNMRVSVSTFMDDAFDMEYLIQNKPHILYRSFCKTFDFIVSQSANRTISAVPFSKSNRSSPHICPSQVAPVLVSRGEKIVGEFQQWGLPGFRGRQQIINARAETVTEKPMFRRSIAFQRCVIPATGFYEWDAAKHKYFFQMPGQPIYLAGIYDNISGVNCFIILTTAPNDTVAPIHGRMPLLLSHEQVRPWLVDAGAALELLCSRPPLLLRTSCDGQLGFDDLA